MDRRDLEPVARLSQGFAGLQELLHVPRMCGSYLEPAHVGSNLETYDRPDIDWVIVGGESGPDARPMHPDWVRSIRDQCQAAGVPFFFKQWGEWLPAGQGMITKPGAARTTLDDLTFFNVGKKKAGRELDGRSWDQMPETQKRQD